MNLKILLAGAAAKTTGRAPTGKSRLIASRKPAGKAGGLGVKKTAKVDESVFDQAPAEEPVTAVSSPSGGQVGHPACLQLCDGRVFGKSAAFGCSGVSSY